MTQSGQKTALPWKSTENSRFIYVGKHPNNHNVDLCIGEMESSEDAAFIVLAANNHDALVEGLEKCKSVLSKMPDNLDYGNRKSVAGACNEMIDALLASIKG